MESVSDETEFGPYRLTALLGTGAGQVWRARESASGRELAVKLFPASWAQDVMFARRFRHEARLVAGLDDPHVIPVYDYGERDGRLFLAMRFIQGRDLQTVLVRGPLGSARSADIVGQVADALDAAHAEGLVHRDVRPSNVLFDESEGRVDFVFLTDFGLARTTDPIVPADDGAAGAVETWANLAPEQLAGDAGDARTDVYGLACLLYECLTGTAPFPQLSRDELREHRASATPPPPPSTVVAGVPVEVDAVIAKGMAERPDDRYAAAGEFARAARAALTGEPVSEWVATDAAQAAPVATSKRGWSRRKVTIAVLASVGIMAMVLTTLAAIAMPFFLTTDEVATPRTTMPTSTTPAVYIAPLSVRPVGRALVPQPGQCEPGAPPPPPVPATAPFQTCDVERKAFYELGPEGIALTLTSATALKLPLSDVHAVQLTMDEASSKRFAAYTATQSGKQLAFMRDGLVLAAPAIGEPINGQSIQLSGELTAQTAETIARMLREGR